MLETQRTAQIPCKDLSFAEAAERVFARFQREAPQLVTDINPNADRWLRGDLDLEEVLSNPNDFKNELKQHANFSTSGGEELVFNLRSDGVFALRLLRIRVPDRGTPFYRLEVELDFNSGIYGGMVDQFAWGDSSGLRYAGRVLDFKGPSKVCLDLSLDWPAVLDSLLSLPLNIGRDKKLNPG